MKAFESGYGAAGKITAAQKLAELACERAASHKGEALVARFWALPGWRRAFQEQVRAASRLLLLYDHEAALAALQKNPRIRSLNPGFVADLVRAEQDRIDREARRSERADPIAAHDATSPPRRGPSRGESVRSKLEGL